MHILRTPSAIPHLTLPAVKVQTAPPHAALLPRPLPKSSQAIPMSTPNRLRQRLPAAASTPLPTLLPPTTVNLGSRKHRRRPVRILPTNPLRPASQSLPLVRLLLIRLLVLSLKCRAPGSRFPPRQRHPRSISPREAFRANGNPSSHTLTPQELAPSQAQANFRPPHFPLLLRRNKLSNSMNATSAPRVPRPFRDQAPCASTRTHILATNHFDALDQAAAKLSPCAPT